MKLRNFRKMPDGENLQKMTGSQKFKASGQSTRYRREIEKL